MHTNWSCLLLHVSQLKAYRGDPPQTLGTLPVCDTTGEVTITPYAVLDRRMARKGNVAAVYVLFQWFNGTVEDATWEEYDDIATRFPDFDLNA